MIDADETQLLVRLADAETEIARFKEEPAEANKCEITVNDDSFSLCALTLTIHEDGIASRVKAIIKFSSHHEFKALIREVLDRSMELDQEKPEAWECLDMRWVL